MARPGLAAESRVPYAWPATPTFLQGLVGPLVGRGLLKNPLPCLHREVPWEVSPFTDQEAADVQECLRDIAEKNGHDPTRTVERWWPVIRSAADVCALNLSFDALRSDDPKPTRNMRRSLQRVQETGNLPRNIKHQNALEYGARRAGLKGSLCQLTSRELRVAAQVSLAHGPINNIPPGNTPNILFDIGGRPNLTLHCRRQSYPEILSYIYRRITDKPPGYSTSPDGKARSGPAVRFFSACLSPFHPNPTPEAMVGIVRKLRKRV